MASIAVIGGFSLAIWILCKGEHGGEGTQNGDTRDELLMGVGNNRGFSEKDSELKPVDVSLCAEATKLGVGKYFVFLGLCQGTASRETGVTRISPSSPRPGEETSTGTLLKFRKWETSKGGLPGN
jgi:hypothetical protein